MARVRTTVLLLGHTGKVGSAVRGALPPDARVVGKSREDFDAADVAQVQALVAGCAPDIIVNAVGFSGVDACEREPERAFIVNALLPACLAGLAAERDATLVHFSTDAVFGGEPRDSLTEEDAPSPVNVYGVTKHGGECLVRAACARHYIFRLPLLFGPGPRADQFVERMLARLEAGRGPLRVAADIVTSPTYSLDAAERVREMLSERAPYGTYHLANEGRASLYDLVAEAAAALGSDVSVERASFRDFPSLGRRSTHTPLRSVRTTSLRPWREALRAYCRSRGDGTADRGPQPRT